MAELDEFVDVGQPNRLTADGRSWLAGLQSRLLESSDEREHIAMAKDFVESMGTMLTSNVARAVRTR